MAIHGIISTYFGDLEYDIGKSLNWLRYFVDDTYVMDINTSESSRQFVVNWDYNFPFVKYSFYSKSFFGSAAKAASWRKESFTRAKSAWSYGNDDWVIFIDGTEGMNVFHKPPVEITVSQAEMVQAPSEGFPQGGVVTFTTDTAHGAVTGNVFQVEFANLVEGSETYNLDGRYEIIDVPSTTTLSVYKSQVLANIDMEPLESPCVGLITTEPPGYLNLNYFQSWIDYEIAGAVSAGKDMISLDGWALVRSDPPVETEYTSTSQSGVSKTWVATSSEKSYIPMGRLVRIAKVSALSDPDFDWQVLDQPQTSFPDAYDAENLSLLSYAYCRWADSPSKMTQSADNTAPNYAVGDYFDPYLKPVNRVDDIGYNCRQLISTVRPISGLPISEEDWGFLDPLDQKPTDGEGTLRFEVILYPVHAFIGGEVVEIAYRNYGGSPAYVNVFRNNLREGLWFTSQGAPPKTTAISSISVSGGVAVATTPKAHSLLVGSSIIVYGTDAVFDGEYVVSAVTSTSFSFQMVTEPGYTYSDTYPAAYAATKSAAFGPVPWNYSTNRVSIPDPYKRMKDGIANQLSS